MGTLNSSDRNGNRDVHKETQGAYSNIQQHTLAKVHHITDAASITKLESLTHFQRNYETQSEHYRRLGWLKKKNNIEGIEGLGGEFYKIPTLKEVEETLLQKTNLLQYKAKQGFTRFVLVPFGLSYIDMYESLGEEYKRYSKDPRLGLYRARDSRFHATIKDVYILDHMGRGGDYLGDGSEADQLYYPEQLTGYSHEYKAVKKSVLLSTQKFPGWELHILQDNILIPQEDQKMVGDRPQIKAGRTPEEYLDILKGRLNPVLNTNGESVYQAEVGLTPEVAAALGLDELRTWQSTIFDSRYGANSGCTLVGMLTKNMRVPVSYTTDTLVLGDSEPDVSSHYIGTISSVKVC